MRILYVSQYFPPEMGAPAARVHELSRQWVRQIAILDHPDLPINLTEIPHFFPGSGLRDGLGGHLGPL